MPNPNQAFICVNTSKTSFFGRIASSVSLAFFLEMMSMSITHLIVLVSGFFPWSALFAQALASEIIESKLS